MEYNYHRKDNVILEGESLLTERGKYWYRLQGALTPFKYFYSCV